MRLRGGLLRKMRVLLDEIGVTFEDSRADIALMSRREYNLKP